MPPVEIVLFFVEDARQEIQRMLRISDALNDLIVPRDMLKLCVASILRHLPTARIVSNNRRNFGVL